MSHSTAPSMCPCSWASLLTSTSTTRTVGSSRWASSHSGSARTPSPAPGSWVGAFFSGAVVIVISSGSLILDCSSFAARRRYVLCRPVLRRHVLRRRRGLGQGRVRRLDHRGAGGGVHVQTEDVRAAVVADGVELLAARPRLPRVDLGVEDAFLADEGAGQHLAAGPDDRRIAARQPVIAVAAAVAG